MKVCYNNFFKLLNDREIRKIQEFIKQNYQEMYLKWSEYSIESYYGQKN